MYLSEKFDIRIQHARNGGEKRIGPFKVDGFAPATNTVYEFHGCIWHGCPECYPTRTRLLPGNARTVQDAYQETLARKQVN